MGQIEECRIYQYNNNNNSFIIVFRQICETPRGQRTDLERARARYGECNRDSGDGTRGRECRVTVINPKKLLHRPSSSLLYALLLPLRIFMFDGRRTQSYSKQEAYT